MGAERRFPVILVVDDEPLVRSTVCGYLEHMGHVVTAAASGDEAYRMVREGARFDLLLTDIRMPGEIDGFELIDRVRALRPRAAVIAMSAYAGSDQGARLRADVFLRKPFTIARLEQAVSELLAAPVR